MARRSRTSVHPFGNLGPLSTPIPISTGIAKLIPETDGSVLLEINGVPSSHLAPDPEDLVFEYMRWMRIVIDHHLESLPPSHTAQLAHLGGAGCSLPRAVASAHPNSRQTVVEVDGQLAELVRVWFDLPRSPQLRIRVEDARHALEAWRPERFDLLIRDVFAGDTTPDSLLTVQAARAAARALRPGGIYLANCAAPPGTGLLADEVATLATVFTHVGVIAEPAHLAGKRRGNCVLLASDHELPEGIDRSLRSDAVSVRLARPAQIAALARAGRIREEGQYAAAPDPSL